MYVLIFLSPFKVDIIKLLTDTVINEKDIAINIFEYLMSLNKSEDNSSFKDYC